MRSQYEIRVDTTRNGQRRLLFAAGVDERAVARTSAAERRLGARNAEERQVVLDRRECRHARCCESSGRCRRSAGRVRAPCPSRISGFSLREISFELSGSGTMSSVRPNDSTRSRSRVSDSTDQVASSFGAGSRLQMWLTPKPASTRRIASESPCCVPAFMRATPGFPIALAFGCAATWARRSARPARRQPCRFR